MPQNIILVDRLKDWQVELPTATFLLSRKYISDPEYYRAKDVQIINLCRSYRYLSLGYYCSLLAEARQQHVIPSVRTIIDLSSKSIYGLNIENLQEIVLKSIRTKSPRDDISDFEFHIYLGKTRYPEFQELGHQIFELFRAPLLKVILKKENNWGISSIKSNNFKALMDDQRAFFMENLEKYAARRWSNPRTKIPPKYYLAILHNPAEKLPPSNAAALKKFSNAGKYLGIGVDLIERRDFSSLAEYDALFIRETTQIDHYTYRFAQKAAKEGMVVIDDPDSIIRCTNKVYLTELLLAHKIPIPKTVILKKSDKHALENIAQLISYPIVLKIPDGSFSRGIFRAHNDRELKSLSTQLFKESDLILAQEFLFTEFDWRVGILNHKVLFVCQYFMSKKHWQIVKHDSSGKFTEGNYLTIRIEDTPKQLLKIALKTAKLIGNGLYGVDLKQNARGIYVMEINDNPNIDAGVEDKYLGKELYRTIIREFIHRLEQQNISRSNDRVR